MNSDGQLNPEEAQKPEENPNPNQSEPKTYQNPENEMEGGESSSSGGGLSKGVLIAIIVAAIVVVVVVVVVLVVTLKDDDFLSWEKAYEKAEEHLKDYTIEEKSKLCYNSPMSMAPCGGCIAPNTDRGFPGMCLNDGPTGVRPSLSTQSWQAGINLAMTFNRDLAYDVGKAQGKEFKDKGINVYLGPCINLVRHPRGGRVWEGYSEDPFLTGETAVEFIKGIQKNGVIACLKHFVLNEIEHGRQFCTSDINNDQALFDVYIEPFYKAIKKADVASLMESYNAVDGVLMTRNKRLLQNIIKDKFGFKGFITSDWTAIKFTNPLEFSNGLDMDQPGFSGWQNIPNWVAEGSVTQEKLHDSARRILAAMYKFKQIPDNPKSGDLYPNFVDLDKDTLTSKTKKLNRKTAGESMVLLKNLDNTLPILKNEYQTHKIAKVAVIGNNADDSFPCLRNMAACDAEVGGQTINYFEGNYAIGYGSGATDFTYLVTPISTIRKKANEEGWAFASSTSLTGTDLTERTENINGLPNVCSDADFTFLFIGALAGEELRTIDKQTGDRDNLEPFKGGAALVNKVISDCPNTKIILIIYGPATVNIDSWKDLEIVKGIIFAGFPGAESGNALADILFGEISPSGHLSFVWAPESSYSYIPSFQTLSDPPKDEVETDRTWYNLSYSYSEGLFLGQRYFDSHSELTYHYPFGFGLSYSTFEFSDLEMKMEEKGLTVKFKVKNTGKYKAKVVPMVFLGFPVEDYPIRVLKGYDKKEIKKGKTKSFKILIDEHDLSIWSISKEEYERVTSGTFKVYIGENARDFQLTGEVSASY